MKTKRILAASSAALFSFASVAVVASAAVDIADIDEDGVEIGAGVTAFINEKDLDKFGDDYNISASDVAVAAGDTDKDGNELVSDGSDVVKDLSKDLKKTIAKIKKSEFTIIDIDLADGAYVVSTAPAAIKFTANVPCDAKVYHVNGENVELLKSSSRKKTDGTYDVSFSSKTFGSFIFTTADLKNTRPSSSGSSSGSTDIADMDGESMDIGADVAAVIPEKDLEKFGDDFNIEAKDVDVDETAADENGKKYVNTECDAVKGLSKSLKKEIAKIESDKFAIKEINLADGDYVVSSAPAAITITVTVGFDAKVYHIDGENVELLKSKSRKMVNGLYEITFSTKSFSPFIFTTAELKNAKASSQNNNTSADASDTSAAADGSSASAAPVADPTTNPPTGIALSIAPVVLAAGAVAVVACKKKH